MPGPHWVALCFSESGYAEYFDSYGLPSYNLEIMSYLQNHSISWTFNHQTTRFNIKLCGHYCCLYALHRVRGLSMTSFSNMFSPARYTCNDIGAVRMFRSQFGECPVCNQLEHQQQSCSSQVEIKVRTFKIVSLQCLS